MKEEVPEVETVETNGVSKDPPTQEFDRPGKIMVAGIPKDNTYTEAELEKEFKVFGRITEAYIVRDRRSHRSRGFAFITYENPTDAVTASKAMEGKDLGGDRPIHCEQAVVGSRKDSNEEGSRGRGGGRGRGRGDWRGRGFDRGGRGTDRGWRGGRGGGRGMDFGEFRGDPRGGRGFRGGMRGRGDGMRGRGRGDYFEPDMRGDNFYHHGDHGPPEMSRGRSGRRTLLPNPSFRGQGPPPGPPHGPRGPPMMPGGNDYYDEGPDGYYDQGEGRGRGSYNDGYDDGYREDDYYEQPPYRDERRPQRGPGGGRGGYPTRGRGMPHPHEGGGRMREEPEYSQPEEDYPPRRGREGGAYGDRGSGAMRRGGQGPTPSGRGREDNPSKDYNMPPRRWGAGDDYGYPAEDSSSMRRKEGPRGAQVSGQYQEDNYEYESRQRHPDPYESAARGRPAPGGRGAPVGGRGAAGQRRAPLLGHDPFKPEESTSGYYEGVPSQNKNAAAYQEEDDYSYSRGGQPSSRRRPPTADDGYGYEAAPAARAAPSHDGAYSQKRVPAGPSAYDDGYQNESMNNMRAREDYDNLRQSSMHRPEMDYSSRANDYSHRGSDMYASYAPQARAGAADARDVDSDPYGRKRRIDYEEDPRMAEVGEVRRDYQGFQDRSGAVAGPPATKRDRYDGFYQSRQEEVYREL